jgi:hydrogenase expression/formation protein HypE
MDDERISLAHGNGGRFMRELINEIFARHLANPLLDTDSDAVAVPLTDGEVLVTTDGFTVQPLEFPGGDIGSLSVHGTVNDLAVAGAKPLYLTLNAFIEEGLEVALLDRIVASLAAAAGEAGVVVTAGDTKVLRRGEGGGLYLATTGVGIRQPGPRPAMSRIQDGDVLLVSGTVGDHGTAVMLAREDFGLRGDLRSDSASVLPLTTAMLQFEGLRFMRDPTRGGVASVANEIARATGMGVRLEPTIPVTAPVQSVCEMLGYDPLYLACEGRVIAVIDAAEADAALAAWQLVEGGRNAARIGRIVAAEDRVILETELGGERFLEELEDDPLPRIC